MVEHHPVLVGWSRGAVGHEGRRVVHQVHALQLGRDHTLHGLELLRLVLKNDSIADKVEETDRRTMIMTRVDQATKLGLGRLDLPDYVRKDSQLH